MSKRAIYGKLAEARRHVHEDAIDPAADCLREAIGLALAEGEDKLLGTASWRLTDLLREAGRPEEMLAALDTLVAHADPFAKFDGAKAWHAMNATARKFWDYCGYDTDRLIPLFDKLRDHYQSSDPYMAAQADELAAWQHACRGNVDGMRALLDRYDGLTPAAFGTGRHRHTRADGAGSSVYWVAMEIARAAVRMGAWMDHEPIARRAYDMHVQASIDAGQNSSEFPHFLEAAMTAALQFGWEEVVETSRSDYETAIRRWDGGRKDYHQAMHRAITLALAGESSPAADAWRDVATIADEMHYGPEWVGDTLLRASAAAADAGRTEDAERWRAHAAKVIDEYGFEAMRGRLG